MEKEVRPNMIFINYGVRCTLFVWMLKKAPEKKKKKNNTNSNPQDMSLIDGRCVTQLGIQSLPAAFPTRCSFRNM